VLTKDINKLKRFIYEISLCVSNNQYYIAHSLLWCSNFEIEPKYDIGIKYFSSSCDKDFRKDQKENSQNYKYKVIKIFETRKEALRMEIKLHDRFNVGVNESFYNKSKQTINGYDTTGTKRSQETCRKISESKIGKKHSDQRRKINSECHKGYKHKDSTKKKISQLWKDGILRGHKHTDETKRKISENPVYKTEKFRKDCSERMKSNVLSEETKKKMSEALKGKTKPKIECPHCSKVGGKPAMMRHHFENCKYK